MVYNIDYCIPFELYFCSRQIPYFILSLYAHGLLNIQGQLLKNSSPTTKEGQKLPQASEEQFPESDESAYSIIPSRMSSQTSASTNRPKDCWNKIRDENLVYRQLSFENELYTARVYKRNYRDLMTIRLLKKRSPRDSDTITPLNAMISTQSQHQIRGDHGSIDSLRLNHVNEADVQCPHQKPPLTKQHRIAASEVLQKRIETVSQPTSP